MILLCAIGLPMSNKTSGNTLLIILIPLIIFVTIFLVLIITLCAVKTMCVPKKTSEDLNQQPTYEEITQCHTGMLMEGNAAYGHITHASRKS